MRARNSAAALIGQLRVISWNTLARIEQPANQILVDGRVPVGGADDLLHDDAVAIDDEALRNAGGLVNLTNRAVLIVEDLKRQPHIPHEPGDDRRVLLVHADRDELKVGARELVVQPLHRWHLDLTRGTPRRPD